MTPTHALSLVCRAAEAHANGHSDCLAILEAVKRVREMEDMREALEDMVAVFGNPHRDEWMNDWAFEYAKAVDARARAVLSKISPPPDDLKLAKNER